MRDRSQVLSVALACLSMWVADASGDKLSRASADMGSAGPPLRKKSRIEISMSRRPAKECLQDAARSSEERKTLPWPAHNAMAPAAWKARSPIGRRTLRRSHAHRCSDVPIMQLFNPTHETTAAGGLDSVAAGSRRLGPIRHVFGSATDRTPAMPLCEEVEFCRLITYAVEKRKINSNMAPSLGWLCTEICPRCSLIIP